MAPSDLVYCEQCGGASPRRATACRFCGAPLPPPRAPVRPPPPASAGGAPAAGSSGWHDDDPWAELHEPDGAGPEHHEHEPWVDPDELPWRGAAGDDPAAGHGDTQAYGPPAAGEPYGPPTGALPPTQVHGAWSDADLIEPVGEEPRRGLPGWAWLASVVLLGTLLGVGAYIVVDHADDGAVRTEESTTTSTSSTTSTTVATTTVAPTAPPTTAPIVPATPPATAPDSGPPTVPGAVTAPTTLAPTTVPTTPAPTTAPPTTPAPTTAAPTTPAPTTAPPNTPAPTTAAPTTAPVPGTVPGDLGIPGVPMAQPPCDGQYVTFLASVKNTTASAMQEALASYPGSQYLRTDQTCPSLNAPASDGAPLYRIFVGPYADVNEACAARALSTQGAFVKRLSNDDPPTHAVACP